jgi:plastocyanin
MKKSPAVRITLFCLGLLVFSSAVIYGSVKLYAGFKPNTSSSTCKQKGVDHLVIIKNNAVTPAHTNGKLCDTMTVTNTDDVLRYIAFGRHDEHQPYDGITEKTIEKDQSFTITMDEAGSYKFHDHLHDEVQGTFTVQR